VTSSALNVPFRASAMALSYDYPANRAAV